MTAGPSQGTGVCPKGSVMTQQETSNGWILGCQECQPGQYPGPGWQCSKCPGKDSIWYEAGGFWRCGCNAGFTLVGQDCVTDADFNELKDRTQLDNSRTY